jgi:metallo-beta-lactamase class B
MCCVLSLLVMLRTVLVTLLALASQLHGQRSAQERADWNRPVKPFRIIGNVYYVGVRGVSAFLINSTAGSILLDGGFPETAPLIEASITALGFRLGDVKYLVNSHAHYDHCGGLAELKKRSGAKMVASEADSNGRGQLNCVDPQKPSPAVGVDRVIADNQTVQLGDVTLTGHLTPGHTKGCTTWSMPVIDSGKTYQVVFYCSTTVVSKLVGNPEYPNIVADYEQSFEKLRKLLCDVFLAPHDGFFRLHEKAEAVRGGRKGAFVDAAEMRKHVDQSERAFRAALAREWK